MISEHAIIHPAAKLAADVTVGPWTFIGEHVEIDSGCTIESHVVIKGPTKIGKNNHFYQFSSIGEAPQDKKYCAEDTTLEIGDNNCFREYVTLNRGTVQGGGRTCIGSNNWIMAYVHVAHDCMIGDNIIFANNASLAGHVIVDDWAIISGFSCVHQFCHVGAHCFVAKASYVTKDVLPYVMVAGYSPTACGLNSVGLKRRNFSREAIRTLRHAYKIIFRHNLTVEEALVELHTLVKKCPEVSLLIEGLQDSTRGIVR
jgi:UDP-N-acetylglucosamine acyltransferase